MKSFLLEEILLVGKDCYFKCSLNNIDKNDM